MAKYYWGLGNDSEKHGTWLIKFSKHVGVSPFDNTFSYRDSNSDRKRVKTGNIMQSANAKGLFL